MRRSDTLARTVALYEGGPLAATPIPGALWLFGTVLAGAAGIQKWRKRPSDRSLGSTNAQSSLFVFEEKPPSSGRFFNLAARQPTG
jgi:hypothetical protein